MKRRRLDDTAAAELMAVARSGNRQKISTSVIETIRELIAHLGPKQKMALIEALQEDVHGGVDFDYIKCLLFPQIYSGDVPQNLTNFAFARFTDKQSIIMPASPSGGTSTQNAMGGSGMILWYPQTTQGPSAFCKRFYGPAIQSMAFGSLNAGSNGSGAAEPGLSGGPCQHGFFQKYGTTYQKTALVSAEISIQYVGQAEAIAGTIAGAHIFGQNPDSLRVSDVDCGQYKVGSTTSEGIRMVWLPQQQTDYEFYPTSTTIAHNSGSASGTNETQIKVIVGAPSDLLVGTIPIKPVDTTLQAHMATYINTTGLNTTVSTTTDPTPYVAKQASASTTMYPTPEGWTITYQAQAPYIAIYWVGLPGGPSNLKVDITRRFNGIPLNGQRDVIGVQPPKKGIDFDKTVNVVKSLCRNSAVGGQTLQVASEVQIHLEDQLLNIPAAIEQGTLKDITKMDELATVLETAGPQS